MWLVESAGTVQDDCRTETCGGSGRIGNRGGGANALVRMCSERLDPPMAENRGA